jgi:MYXO-CTERM domain-containing protein
MRCRSSAVLVGSLLFLTTTAGAVVPHTGRRIAADALTAMPSANLGKPLRTERAVRWSNPPMAAWQHLAVTGTWQAAWDRATGVPVRIWGSGLAAPGSSASADVAAAFARAALVAHLALLAPGASPADFELVSNVDDGEMRSVGFVQRHDGRVVVGGQVSFRFKHDRLFVIGSEALPNITLPAQPRARLSGAAFQGRAAANLRRELALPEALVIAPGTAPGEEVVLPLVGDDAVLGYRLAVPVTIDGGAEGRYLAYSDPATGETLAVRLMTMFASGSVLYRGVDRYPGKPRIARPAPRAHVTLNGAPQTTSPIGQVSWGDNAARTLATAVVGDLVAIVNKASGGVLATAQLSLAAGGQVVWDASAVTEDDAQVQTYLNANTAKDFARQLDPGMPMLDQPITANVNIAQDCNAFFDGTSINFFHASAMCQNTGLIQDVVFHEYGHAVHMAEVIKGVGAFDGAMSEGAADFFAAQITGDPQMGRGFFYTDAPLRDLDPATKENRWPDDIGEIHKTGLIFGGTFWDLRKALIAELGEPLGVQVTEKLYLGALRRSVSIPTSLVEVLAADDDDGDLANGTPHECTIRNAYARHGLRTATGTVAAPAHLEQPTRATTVHIELGGLAERCAGDELAYAELSWKPAGEVDGPAGTAMAVQTAPAAFYAELPLPTDDKILYQVRIVFKDASVLILPDNRADPYYQLYQGRTVPLYCTTFEDGNPLMAGWKTGTRDGKPSPWAWGVSTQGSTDPHAAFSGSHALVQVLDGDYDAKTSSYVQMPPIDIGQWSDVHLQYRRWLAVEDSHFDQARITVGDQQAWVNYTENMGDSSATQHIDREWRFQDVEVSGYQGGHTLDLGWDLTSDEGLEFGGWAIDDVCVVANVGGVCGDGVVTAHEACDDGAGNADRANACRTWCQLPICGDGIVDHGEECDVGSAGNSACTASCETVKPPDLGGCCSAERGAGGPWALGALVLGLVLRRRRRPLR